MSKDKFFVLPPAYQGMDGFTSLRKAVRYILEAEELAEQSDDPYDYDTPAREILDENGDPVEVDWDADEYKTRAQLAQERDRAKAATISATDSKLRADKALFEHQKHLIDAGLIPIDLLNDFISDIRMKSDHMASGMRLPDYGIAQAPARVTVDMQFVMAAPGTAAHYALDKLVHHKR